MTSTRRAGLVMALLFLTLSWPPGASAQDPSFTSDQVTEGGAAYREHCASCHGPRMQGEHLSPSLVGARFDRAFRGKSAAVLAFHLRRMPPEPAPTSGSLGDATYANIVAHILAANGFAAGDDALPSDVAALRELTIPGLEGAEIDVDAPVVAVGDSALLNSLTAVTDETLLSPSPDDWLHTLASYDAHTYSSLEQINRDNVEHLAPAWRTPLRAGNSMPMPLVHQGVMFLHTFPDTVLALDASNGQVLWRHQHEPSGASSQKMGLALHGDKVLVPTSDLHVLALRARTGELIWDHEIAPPTPAMRAAYNLRSAPLLRSPGWLPDRARHRFRRRGLAIQHDRSTGRAGG